jgi:hypothetical protein
MLNRKTHWLPILALMLALVATGCSTTQKAEKPADTSWMYHTIVDADFVKPYATVPQPEGVMIIDSRPAKPKYVNGHIPSAVSIPDSQFDKMKAQLPEDKNTLLIFYCEGPT